MTGWSPIGLAQSLRKMVNERVYQHIDKSGTQNLFEFVDGNKSVTVRNRLRFKHKIPSPINITEVENCKSFVRKNRCSMFLSFFCLQNLCTFTYKLEIKAIQSMIRRILSADQLNEVQYFIGQDLNYTLRMRPGWDNVVCIFYSSTLAEKLLSCFPFCFTECKVFVSIIWVLIADSRLNLAEDVQATYFNVERFAHKKASSKTRWKSLHDKKGDTLASQALTCK